MPRVGRVINSVKFSRAAVCFPKRNPTFLPSRGLFAAREIDAVVLRHLEHLLRVLNEVRVHLKL